MQTGHEEVQSEEYLGAAGGELGKVVMCSRINAVGEMLGVLRELDDQENGSQPQRSQEAGNGHSTPDVANGVDRPGSQKTRRNKQKSIGCAKYHVVMMCRFRELARVLDAVSRVEAE